MLGKTGFWIARPALDAAYQQRFAEPLRTRRAGADVAPSGERLDLQIAELEWPAGTGLDVTGQPPGRPKRRRNRHEYYRRCAERECHHRQRL
jgi:hypothetical protein